MRSDRNCRSAEGNTPVIFVTGTNTGAGKTTITSLLLEWLRNVAGVEAYAIKPFITGGLSDARVLAQLQPGRLGVREISPFRYQAALAPAVAASIEGRPVCLRTALSFIEGMRKRCDCLLVEGCGGVLTPLGSGYSALEMIDRLRAHVVVAAPNQLGVINELRLTWEVLKTARVRSVRVVLTNQRARPDLAMRTNPAALRRVLGCEIQVLPYFQEEKAGPKTVKKRVKIFQKTLAALLPSATVTALLEAAVVRAVRKKK